MFKLKSNSKIFIAGHNGMFGSALVRLFKQQKYTNLITVDKSQLNLLDQQAVYNFLKQERPELIIIAAAKVGGILANIEQPYDFLMENLIIQNNLITGAKLADAKKVVFLGSSCIYPRLASQPMKEDALLTGMLEPTNEGYALAKIAGLKSCELLTKQYGIPTMSVMPCNLYGPNDSFDPEKSHVLSALVKKFCDAKESGVKQIVLWGTGSAKREFMHIDDAAEAVLHLLHHYHSEKFINIGSGSDLSIKELATLIKSKTGYKGEIEWDISRPDGMPRKCLDITKLNETGYKNKISLEKGIEQMIEIYINKIR